MPRPFVCWAPGTPAATIAAFNRRRIDKGIATSLTPSPYRVFGGRWSRTATDGGGLKQGQPTTLRYSFVPDGTPITGFAGEADAPSNLQARLTTIYGSKAAWLAMFARVGAALSAQSGLNYVYEPNDDGALFGPNANGDQSPGIVGTRGDIRVSGHTIDGNSGTLAYNFAPDISDMVIDTGDNFFTTDQGKDLGFRNTITHEFGHGVGLGHTCPINETKLMEPFVSFNFDGPQFDDIRGLQRFYGDDLENDDTAATGTDLGALADGTVNAKSSQILSIDNGTDPSQSIPGDVDFFRFSIPANKSLSITVRPTGEPYLEGPQNDDDSCTAGTRLDPKLINDLGFELFQDGVSVGTTNSSPVGGNETLPATNFPGGGQFSVRVFGGINQDVQTYAIDITVGPPVVGPTPVPTPTVGPTPTPAPTGVPTPTPLPQPTAIRPIVDLNGANDDGSTGQDSPVPNGIDNTSRYFFRSNGTLPDGKPGIVGLGGAQIITPGETLVLSDISAQPVIPGKAIVEARVELTPDNACGGDPITQIPGGIAPDNCNFVNKRDNEVLSIAAADLKSVNDQFGSNLTAAYDINTQILTIKGGSQDLDSIRGAYQAALRFVRYENKLPIVGNTQGFTRNPSLDDRIITYVVDTDNDASNNNDRRFAPQDPGNPKQSKPAVLTLRFQENPSLIVTTLSDNSAANDNQTSLREAIEAANDIPFSTRPDPTKPAVPSPTSVITFAPGLRGTINLTRPLPPISAATDVTIQGPGARTVTVNGSASGSGIFQIFSNTTITGLTISGGTADAANSFGFGGGIYNSRSVLTVDFCTISGNSAQFGGGIANLGGSLTLTNSTVSGNSATGNGAGIYLDNSVSGAIGVVNISNSTISGNAGSGISQVSGRSTTALTTITKNTQAGVLVSGGGTRASFNNSIIAGNATNSDVASASSGTFVSGGYNVIGTGTGVAAFTPGNNDITGISGDAVGLGALGNNGGPTDTHALFAGSPAIDKGDPAIQNPPVTVPPTPALTDQRGEGFPRIIKARVDIGAYERQDDSPVVNPVITPRNPTTDQTITVNANSDTTNLVYTFFVNGNQRQTGASNTFDLSQPGFGDRGQTVSVSVTATNANGSITRSDSVVVINTAPTLSVTITATNPNSASTEVLTNSVLTANPVGADADTTALSYTYQWKVNGQVLVQETGKTIDLSKPGNGDRDDVVSVDVTANDGAGGIASSSASVNVGNTAPVAQNVTFTVAAGQTVRILLTALDVDAVDTKFTFAKTSEPTKGTATIEINSDGRGILVYTANAGAVGPDSLTFTATDTVTFTPGGVVKSAAKTSGNATATANPGVVPNPTPGPTPTPGPNPTPGPTPSPTPTDTNRPPAGANSSVNTLREVPIVKALALSDPDIDDTYDTLQVIRLAGGLRKGTGDIRKDTDGVWKLFYKASRLYDGNDQVSYVVRDKKGAQSVPATITINIFNTKPTARSTQMQVAAGGSASVALFGQDNDNDALTFQRVGGPSKGSGEIRRGDDGFVRFFYQNSPAAVGNDQVQFVTLDGKAGGVSEVATINITVVGVFNRAPSAQNVSGTTTAGTPVAVAVSGTDPDEGDVLTFKRVGGPSNGTGEILKDEDGTFKMFYTPRPDFVGTETIRYVALDSKGKPSAPATITITVTGSGTAAVRSGPAPSGGSS